MTCINCGGKLIGDGFQTVRHCENASESDLLNREPDSGPVYCSSGEEGA